MVRYLFRDLMNEFQRVRELSENSELPTPNWPYKVKKSRLEGELDLAKIAAEASREYCWVFDSLNETWNYWSHISTKNKESIGLKVPSKICENRKDSEIFYHTHPDHALKIFNSDFSRFDLTIPSRNDIKFAIKFKEFKEFSIVSSLGTTTYKYDCREVFSDRGATSQDKKDNGHNTLKKAIGSLTEKQIVTFNMILEESEIFKCKFRKHPS